MVSRSQRVQVMQETLEACRRGGYQTPAGDWIRWDREEVARNVARGRLHQLDEFQPRSATAESPPGFLEAVEGDCLLHALELQDRGLDVCCLNMASHKRPGGGYLSGAGAQEENLFRRTNYVDFIGDPATRPNAIQYPLPEFAGIHSRDVVVFRGAESDGYPWLPAPRRMSFIAVAAYSRPPLTGEPGKQRLAPPYDQRTCEKIRLILEIGLAHGHNAIVLSALGCGAFQNPPAHLAELFAQVIDTGGYRRIYRHLRFAIIDDRNAQRASNPEGNLAPFQKRFLSRSGNDASK